MHEYKILGRAHDGRSDEIVSERKMKIVRKRSAKQEGEDNVHGEEVEG